jgi:hypothetical protein
MAESQHEPQPCKHADAAPDHCPPTCACWCDECQARYEDDWDLRAAAEALCPACGMPQGDLSLGRLQLFQYIHFYLPCVECAIRYKAFMQKEGLCPSCRGASSGGDVCAACVAAAAAGPPPDFKPSGPARRFQEEERTVVVRADTPRPSPLQIAPSSDAEEDSAAAAAAAAVALGPESPPASLESAPAK